MPIDPSSALAPTASASGLFLHINAGVVLSSGSVTTNVPQQLVALAASKTNWIFFDLVGLSVAVNQSGFVDPCIPIAKVITDIAFVSALVDARPDFFAGGGGSPGGVAGDAQFNSGSGLTNAAGIGVDAVSRVDANSALTLASGSNLIIIDKDVSDQILIETTDSTNGISLVADGNFGRGQINVNSGTATVTGGPTGSAQITAGSNTIAVGNPVFSTIGIFLTVPGTGQGIFMDADAGIVFSSINSASVVLASGAGAQIVEATFDDKLGFFAAAPVVKPTVTGAKGGNVALTNLLIALANLGLITNSTT